MHGLGCFVLVYYVVPSPLLGVVPKEALLLSLLGVALLLEALRQARLLRVPMIRPYEEHRVASFAYYAIALTVAVLVFPRPVAAAAVLGSALVDPVVGELRSRAPRAAFGLGYGLYVPLAFFGLVVLGHWPAAPSVGLALVAGLLGLAAEGPRIRGLDDDLLMLFVPGLALWGLGVGLLGLGA